MKTLVQLLCRLLPAPPTTELAEHIRAFNAPRIYLPSLGEERARNRTLPQGNLLQSREENSGTFKRRQRRQLLSLNT
jgi:hypothetical protein